MQNNRQREISFRDWFNHKQYLAEVCNDYDPVIDDPDRALKVFNDLYDNDPNFKYGPNRYWKHSQSTTPLTGGNKNLEVAKKMPNKSNTGGRKRYTAAQKKAYYSGMGYATCMEGKAIDFKNEDNKESFKAGLAKGKERAKTLPNRRGGDRK